MIVGRDEEQRAIVDVLDSARAGRGSTLCLIGDPGIGKSTLLEWACELADGFAVVRTTGVESDFDVPYAGVLDVAGALRSDLDNVPSGQRAALEAVVGWTEARDAAHHLVAMATTTLLSTAASRHPLLVLVDDLQWVDRQSSRVIAFAARRLHLDPVAILLARRDHPRPVDDFEGTELRLHGLERGAASRLLTGVAPGVLDRLLAMTAGNPLALSDASSELTAAQRRGSAPLVDPPAVGDRLTRGFGEVLGALSAQTFRAVSLTAAAHDTAAGPIIEALRAEGIAAEEALDEAVTAGVLKPGSSLTFHHPLHRAVVWAATSPAERRSAHQALGSSQFLDPRLRLRHRIEATVGFDDRLSRQAERMAQAGPGRHGYAGAADLLESAARLSSSPRRAAALRAAATEDALVAGDLERVRWLAEQVTEASADGDARARVLLALGIVEEYTGSVPRSRSLLTEAATTGGGLLRLRALAELATVGYRLGEPQTMAAVAGDMVGAADHDDAEQRMLADYMLGASAAFAGRWNQAREPTARALELLETDAGLRDEPRYLVLALSACVWMGEPRRALDFGERRMQRARETGAIGLLPFALTLVAGGYMLFGDHWRGYAYADEAVRLGSELGYVVDVATAQELLAWQHAARGRHREAEEALDEARRLAGVAGVADASVQVELVAAFAALCRGDPESTVRLLERRLEADGGRLPNGDYELAVAPDLAEAYLAMSRTAEAAELAQRHTSLHLDGEFALRRAHAQRLLGMTADDPREAHAAFEQALREHLQWPDPWETARTRLIYGARLRRAGERRAARVELASARTTFEQLGFSAWADRAHTEQAATGERARRGVTRKQSLTAQEARVALLVATGRTNREIAALLFLSPKTIEHHVTAALRKTGTRTRTELAVELSSHTSPDPGPSARRTAAPEQHTDPRDKQ